MNRWRQIVSLFAVVAAIAMLIFFPLVVVAVGTLVSSLMLLAYQHGWLHEEEKGTCSRSEAGTPGSIEDERPVLHKPAA